jgi:PAS domain-containing protein
MSFPLATNGRSPFSAIAEVHHVSPNAVDELLEHLPVAVMLVDRDGRMVYANDAARSLEIERLEPLQWAITRALLTEDVAREDDIEVAVLGKPRRWLSAYVTPIRVLGLGINAAFVVLTDVTARARMAAWTPVIESLVNL